LTIAISIPNVHGKQVKAEGTTTRGKRTRTRSAKMSTSVTRFQGLLMQARESIESIFEHACTICPSTLAQIVGILLGETHLLYSIMSEPDADQNIFALKTIILLGTSSLGRSNCRPFQERFVPARTSRSGIRSETRLHVPQRHPMAPKTLPRRHPRRRPNSHALHAKRDNRKTRSQSYSRQHPQLDSLRLHSRFNPPLRNQRTFRHFQSSSAGLCGRSTPAAKTSARGR